MKILDTVQNVLIIEHSNSWVSFIGDLDVDCDGSGGNPDHDPYFQPDTTLHFKDKALNAQEVPFIVVPPIVVRATKGIILGSQAYVTNLKTGVVIEAVVGDLGPTRKIGEGSPALAVLLGLSGNANYGGTSERIIGYEIDVGVPAIVTGITYSLQKWKK